MAGVGGGYVCVGGWWCVGGGGAAGNPVAQPRASQSENGVSGSWPSAGLETL